ncbi:MAG: hypothetical protein AAGA99_12500 [Actinomycetota bacterium]
MRWVGSCILVVSLAIVASGVGAATATGRGSGHETPVEWLARLDPTPSLTAAATFDEPFDRVGDGASYCLGDDAHLERQGDGSPDLVFVRSTGACDSEPGMTFHVAVADPLDTSALVEIALDVDVDEATGCNGFDQVAAEAPNATVFLIGTPTCAPDQWTLLGELESGRFFREIPTAPRMATETLAVRVPDLLGTLAWSVAVYEDRDPFALIDVVDTLFFTVPFRQFCDGNLTSTSGRDGYWLATLDGELFSLGAAADRGHVCEQIGARSVVDLTLDDAGESWIALQADGGVRTPQGPGQVAVRSVVDRYPWELGADRAVALMIGDGSAWIVYDTGLITSIQGNEPPAGDLRDVELNAPIIDAQPTPSGNGYWLIAADGGVFSFGDAEFSGSTGSLTLNEPVVGMAPDPDGEGYWLVATDGGVFAFDSPFVGSIPGILPPATTLNRPIIAMEPYGNGYLLLGTDGGVFNFSNRAFAGSLGDNPPDYPVVAIQPVP